MKEIIRFRNVVKNYGKVQALKGISFSVYAGRIFGIFGPNGAGKTTAIKIILGILKNDSGEVDVRKGNLSYLPEELSLDQSEKVQTIINYIGRLKKLSKKEREKEVDKWEDILGVKPFLDRKIYELSKGQKKRVMFLLTLLGNPDIIALDEPFTGLDAEAAERLKRLVLSLKAENKTILFSTHILEIAENLCEDVVILKEGKIKELGDVEELKEKYAEKGWIIKLKEDTGDKNIIFGNASSEERDRVDIPEESSLCEFIESVGMESILEIKRKAPDFKELYFKAVGEK